jgi:serine/threonine-protein kinase
VQTVAHLRIQEGQSVTIIPGKTLSAATRALARANCRVGKIRRAYSKTVGRGRVISQRPKFGTVLPGGGKVNLVVSVGAKR